MLGEKVTSIEYVGQALRAMMTLARDNAGPSYSRAGLSPATTACPPCVTLTC